MVWLWSRARSRSNRPHRQSSNRPPRFTRSSRDLEVFIAERPKSRSRLHDDLEHDGDAVPAQHRNPVAMVLTVVRNAANLSARLVVSASSAGGHARRGGQWALLQSRQETLLVLEPRSATRRSRQREWSCTTTLTCLRMSPTFGFFYYQARRPWSERP